MSPSLSHRIVVSVGLGLVVVFLALGVVTESTTRESAEVAAQERVHLAEVLAQRIDEMLNYSLGILQREAREFIIEPGQEWDKAQLERLADIHSQLGIFSVISITDSLGNALWTSPYRADIDIGAPIKHPSVQLALATGKPQVTEFSSSATNRVFACLAVPVLDRDGHPAGALMAEIDPDHPALGLVPGGASDRGAHVSLMNFAGQVLVGMDKFEGDEPKVHRAVLEDLITARLPGYRVHEAMPELGIGKHVVAYSPVSLLPTWGVTVEQQTDVVLLTSERLRQRLLFFGLFTVVAAVLVTWYDVQRVVAPLRHLTAVAGRFANGELDEPVHLQRADELGALAGAFESMRQRQRSSLAEIEEWNRELERRVAARTAEVERLYANLGAKEREREELLQRVINGQEDERRRVAQELHDETGQSLASLRLGLERLSSRASGDIKQLADSLQEVASQALAEVHRMALELRPSVLDDVGLVPALERYLQEWTRRWGIPVDYELLGVDHVRLIPAAETAVYRIAQAALANVAQHADARNVSVLVQNRTGRLVLIVEDDGRGFDLASTLASPLNTRLGLAGMEERASLIGGTLTIETVPGRGTSVYLDVPLDTSGRR